jgi:hypothetical protein
MSTTGGRMLGSCFGKPRRKKTESETVRKIIVERKKSGCCRLFSGMLYQYFLCKPTPQTKERERGGNS